MDWEKNRGRKIVKGEQEERKRAKKSKGWRKWLREREIETEQGCNR